MSEENIIDSQVDADIVNKETARIFKLLLVANKTLIKNKVLKLSNIDQEVEMLEIDSKDSDRRSNFKTLNYIYNS